MKEGDIVMSRKERKTFELMIRKENGEITLVEAAEISDLSYRQIKRIWRRYRENKASGLVHRSRGKASNRSIKAGTRELALALYQEKYNDFGPTLAAEKLEEIHDLRVKRETLRRWLLEEGLWQKRRERRRHRRRRERREHFGELIQMDGSHHCWFGEVRLCLMTMVDDATGTTLALLSEEETTEAAMRLLWMWIKKYGVPTALYTDRKNVYVLDKKEADDAVFIGAEPLTTFGKACHKLGVRIIKARSPQAKGRVERKHAVFQDRWVKELRLSGISDMEAANQQLPAFLDLINRRFAVPPKSSADYHTAAPRQLDLANIFCWEEARVVANDWTIRYKNRFFQILGQTGMLAPRARVIIREKLDGSLFIVYKGKRLQFKEIAGPLPRASKPIRPPASKAHKPAPDHPWYSYRKNRALRTYGLRQSSRALQQERTLAGSAATLCAMRGARSAATIDQNPACVENS